jgi:hypothetical protein
MTNTPNPNRFQVGIMRRTKRYPNGHLAKFDALTVFDRGTSLNMWAAIASYRGQHSGAEAAAHAATLNAAEGSRQ